jgi:cystathionine beta-synthase
MTVGKEAVASATAPAPVTSALDLIGHTPILEITDAFDTGPCRLFLKLENTNPGGSIKDRIARTMIEAAEADGRLKPHGVIVEATAGNTGLGLAQVGILKGYSLVLIVPDKMAREKIQHLRGLGVDVRLTRSDVGKGHPDYYQDIAARLAGELNNAVYMDQFGNPANPLAHETTTGPEMFQQMDGDIDAVVVGVGSGGTLTGLGRFFAKASPKTEMILADPAGSILEPLVNRGQHVKPGSWIVEGIGEDFIPDNCDLSLVKKGNAYAVTDQESVKAARDLLSRAGVLAGSSSGTLLAAALRYCQAQTEPKRVVTFVCDSGNKYLSKVFNDHWLAEQGLTDRTFTGDLRDLIARGAQDGGAVTVGPSDTLDTAYKRMRTADVSQLPVVDGDRLIGLLDESDLLEAVEGGAEQFQGPVSQAMVAKLHTLQAHEPLDALIPIFERDEVAIVLDGPVFLGLITRVDLINHLRRAA